jgi:hypothetical protein
VEIDFANVAVRGIDWEKSGEGEENSEASCGGTHGSGREQRAAVFIVDDCGI